MADEEKKTGRLNRRSMLLGGSSFVAAGALLPLAHAQTTAAPTEASTTGSANSGANGAASSSSTSSAAALTGKGASGKKPNIVVIYGDDIGITNLSCTRSG